jgi:hypothetical protein
MLTLTLPLEAWILAPFLILLYGKALQESGRVYEAGGRWEFDALFGSILFFVVVFGGAFALTEQNAPPEWFGIESGEAD